MSVVIDGTTYDVPIIEMTREAQFLDKYAERTQDGELHRELIGVYFNYSIVFGSASIAVYNALWQKLTEPVTFHEVTVPDEDGDFTFQAYFSGVKDKLRKDNASGHRWNGLTAKFIAKAPARS